MAGSVTKARSHDESSGGRNITEVHGGVTGKRTEVYWGHGNATSRHESVTGAWHHGAAWEGNYKIIDQHVREQVTASTKYFPYVQKYT